MAVNCVQTLTAHGRQLSLRYDATVLDWLHRLHPFKTRESRRLAVLFAIVYFSQGMWYLPYQTITIVFKDAGLSAGQVAAFFSITVVPWLVKPVYGLLSDFVPLFGYRRRSYVLLSSALACLSAIVVVVLDATAYWPLAILFTTMALGLAFTDVITDALMVANGRALNLTGAFQSVQWAAIYTASILVGLGGGYLAETRSLRTTFAIAAFFPAVTCLMATVFVHDTRAPLDVEALRSTGRAVLKAARSRTVWLIASFIFLFTFSPSFGPAFTYYQTDVLKFSQQFIGVLAAVQSVGFVLGAFLYAPLSKRMPLSRLIVLAVSVSAVSTLVYLVYRGTYSALAIDFTFGIIAMMTQLVLLDLAAKSCPPHVEATFFALLMSVYNAGQQGSQVVGGYLYDWYGFTPLVLVSAAATALILLVVPYLGVSEIEARAQAAAAAIA
jgi:predicted MFS family arabinose efflux permease